MSEIKAATDENLAMWERMHGNDTDLMGRRVMALIERIKQEQAERDEAETRSKAWAKKARENGAERDELRAEVERLRKGIWHLQGEGPRSSGPWQVCRSCGSDARDADRIKHDERCLWWLIEQLLQPPAPAECDGPEQTRSSHADGETGPDWQDEPPAPAEVKP